MGDTSANGDLTLPLLRSIRDEIVGLRADTNQRLDQTNQRLDQTNQRLDQTNQRLAGLEVRMERVEHGLVDLGTFMKQLAMDMAKYERFHAHHVEVLERDLDDVKARVRSLEERR